MIGKKILLYYCFFLAVFITISGIAVSKSPAQLLLQVIFLPVTIYLGFMVFKDIMGKNRKEKSERFRVTKTFICTICIFCILLAASVTRILQNTRSKTLTASQPQQGIMVTSSPPPTITPSPATPSVIIRPDDEQSVVNIRISPSISAKVIKKAKYNEKYPLAGEEEKWYKIILENGLFGYISKEVATISGTQEKKNK